MWECMEAAACECSFMDHVEDKNLDKLLHHRNMVSERGEVIEGQAARQARYETSSARRWRAMVSRYSRLSLTPGNGHLPALSGLAKQMNREIMDTYIAGLWTRTLPIDLLWEVSSPSEERQAPWKAPTWSWAHWKSPVDWVDDLANECKPDIHLKLVNTKQVLAGDDDMGEITSASLFIAARLCPATLVVYSPTSGAGSAKADLKMDGVYLNTLQDPGATLYSLQLEIKLDSVLQPTSQYTERNDTPSEKVGRR